MGTPTLAGGPYGCRSRRPRHQPTSTTTTSPSCTGERTVEGFYRTRKPGIDQAISPRPGLRTLVADLIWCETGKPDLAFAKQFRRRHPRQVPWQAAGLQLLAVVQLEEEPRRRDHRQVPARARAAMGYKFQFITLAGFHSLNYSMFESGPRLRAQPDERLRRTCRRSRVRRRREAASPLSSTSEKSAPATSTPSPRPSRRTAVNRPRLKGSTEDEQFFDAKH